MSTTALLTGSTGFLGASLLRDLLVHTSFDVVCLVRAASERGAMDRIRRALEGRRLWDAALADRIRPLPGDISQPCLGLPHDTFVSIGRKVGVVYHAAARTNLVLPYSALAACNVQGTEQILKLAAAGAGTAVHHISSLAVFGTCPEGGRLPETFRVTPATAWTTGYARSKWAAEQLVNDAVDQGLAASIYRPGIVTGHSVTGIGNRTDSISLVLLACMHLRAAPDRYAPIHVTPVDFVSRAIVALSLARPAGVAFHFLNPEALSWPSVADALLAGGYVDRIVPYDEWGALLRGAAAHDTDLEFAAMLALRPVEDRERTWQAEDGNVRAGLAAIHAAVYPSDSPAVLRAYLSTLARVESERRAGGPPP